jgi:magnesium chelatase family protein
VPRIEHEKLTDQRLGESSQIIRARVETARQAQRKRFEGTRLTCNADMTPIEIRDFCQAEGDAQSLLQAAAKQLSLSARSFHRILKLARTIADFESAETIYSHHLAEALQYRPRSVI